MVAVAGQNIHNIHRPRFFMLRVLGINVDSFFTMPGGFGITELFWWESGGAAVTGGIVLGTTDAGTDVLGATAIGANSMGIIQAPALLKSVFSVSPPTNQLLYVHAVTNWSTALLNLYFNCVKLNP